MLMCSQAREHGKAGIIPKADASRSGRQMDWKEPQTLQAWTSAVAADIYRSGIIESKRMDILLGPNVQAGKGEPPEPKSQPLFGFAVLSASLG